MGVYNPNAIMPKNCAVCHEDCKYRNITAHKRHKRCPLVEVKTPLPSAEKQGEWIAKSIETYELPEGQIIVEYDASGVGLISRECMEMLMGTLATNKPKRGEWIPIIEGNEFGETYQSGIYCSECGETLRCEANFCPNCGARMKGADNE